MNGLVRMLVRVGIMVGITQAIEYFATRGTDLDTPEGKAVAKSGRENAKRASRMIDILRRFSRFR